MTSGAKDYLPRPSSCLCNQWIRSLECPTEHHRPSWPRGGRLVCWCTQRRRQRSGVTRPGSCGLAGKILANPPNQSHGAVYCTKAKAIMNADLARPACVSDNLQLLQAGPNTTVHLYSVPEHSSVYFILLTLPVGLAAERQGAWWRREDNHMVEERSIPRGIYMQPKQGRAAWPQPADRIPLDFATAASVWEGLMCFVFG